MARRLGSMISESRRSFHHEKKLSNIEEADEMSSLTQQREISVLVESIENIDPKKVKEIIVRVEFAGNILDQSIQTVTSDKVDIGLSVCLQAEEVNSHFLDEILANPVLFTVLDCSASSATTLQLNVLPNVEKDAKKKTTKTSNSPTSNSKSTLTSANVLGICNLDIGGLAMGETRIKDVLLLEPDKKVAPPDVVNCVKLPRLLVSASTGDEPLVSYSENKFNNAIGITVESVYNIPDCISEGSVFEAKIPVPSLGEKINSVRFPRGTVVQLRDSTCRKKWLNLLHIEGTGARAKYNILPTGCDVINTLPEHVDVTNEMNKSYKVMQWNTWRNSFMIKKDVHYFCSKIMKYRVWPIEISISNKAKEQISKDKSAKSDKKSKPIPSPGSTGADHFIAFLNLSPLLYPGVTKARVAAQLFTYSQSDLINKYGSEFPISNSQGSVAPNGKLKTNSERSKASVREPEESKDSPGLPVFSDDGSPTFIVVEVELYKPLTPKKDPEFIEANLKAQVCLKGKINKKITNLSLVYNDFSTSIKDITSILTEELQNFRLLVNDDTFDENEVAEFAFRKFLYDSENFYKIKATLENKVVELINEKFGELEDYESMIPEIYIYLVNEMHKITNGYLQLHEGVSNTYFNTNDLQLYAEESIEEGKFKAARDYLLLKLSRETSNPNYWLDCAVCCISLNKYEAAVEAVREALNLNFHHQFGLLIYALLMARLNNCTLAEEAFQVLLAHYPDFIEGWMAVKLFYSVVNNIEGVLLAKKMVTKLKCEREIAEKRGTESEISEEPTDRDEFNCSTYKHSESHDSAREGKYGIASFTDGFSWVEPLSWTLAFCPPDNANLRTSILLLKLGFYEYASMCLSQELLSSGGDEKMLPPHYMYYFAVNLYLQGRNEEAISSLLNFVKDYGKDCFVWSLLGHCYYKLQNHERAISCYEYVIESYNRPNDIHLIYLRMGMYYNQAKKYSCAKQILSTACKYSPTPKIWKELGLAYLRMDELEEAEIAFSEANYLDNRDPETWAYLALTNAISRRLAIFKSCFAEARKRNLQNSELQEEIMFYVTLHGLDKEEF